mgnify:CR=1 FL=1
MVCRRSVSGILRKAGVNFGSVYENKKSLSVSELDFLGVTWPAFNEPSVAREACSAIRGRTSLCIYRHTKIF